jgi:mono/diheme cytochrome c family protein/cytochrome c553
VSFETAIVLLNVVVGVAIVLFVLWRVVNLRRNPEVREPMNLAPGMPDEDLEGRKLERVLGWALLFTIILAIALPVYFLFEPNRQATASQTYLKQSVVRGATLFANQQSKYYSSTISLLCANCHGVHGEGGSTPYTLASDLDICQIKKNQNNINVPQCLPQQVEWTAPALNRVLLRFTSSEVANIITYGRPGTPMPPWGVASGKGVLGTQGIDDLVNYLASIQITPAKAKEESNQAIGAFKAQAEAYVTTTQNNLTAAQQTLAQDQAKNAGAATIAADQAAITQLQAELVSAQANNVQTQGLSEGALLFEINCARCHTQNWSFFDPTKLGQPAPAPQGTGAFGPNLTNGATLLQFPGTVGLQEQIQWVTVGVPPNMPYGTRGISDGAMPHFGSMLSAQQILAIVNYERGL